MSEYGGCAGCDGRCCREYLVPLNGQDVWTLSRATGLPPLSFVVLVGVDELSESSSKAEEDATVRLVAGGPTLTMVLDKKPRDDVGSPCVFLLELDSGRARCGVYGSRPSVCRAFPFAFRHGSVTVRRDVACPPRSWNLAAVDLPARRADLLRYELDWAVHRVVAAAWNDQVQRAREQEQPRIHTQAELWDYWLAAYDQVAAVIGGYGSAEFARLALGWGRVDDAATPGWRVLLRRIAERLPGSTESPASGPAREIGTG